MKSPPRSPSKPTRARDGTHSVALCHHDELRRFVQGVHVIYDKPNLVATLGETVAAAGRTQVRIAETKIPPRHVLLQWRPRSSIRWRASIDGTQSEGPYLRPPTRDVCPRNCQPHRPGDEGRERTAPDFICLNFANPDMVGHTGFSTPLSSGGSHRRLPSRSGRSRARQWLPIHRHRRPRQCGFCAASRRIASHGAHDQSVPVVVLSEHVDSIQDGILADVLPRCSS